MCRTCDITFFCGAGWGLLALQCSCSISWGNRYPQPLFAMPNRASGWSDAHGHICEVR